MTERQRQRHPWPHSELADDFTTAVCGENSYSQSPDTRWVGVGAPAVDTISWGCQDHSDVRLGTSEEQVVKQGLSTEGRSTLGGVPVTAPRQPRQWVEGDAEPPADVPDVRARDCHGRVWKRTGRPGPHPWTINGHAWNDWAGLLRYAPLVEVLPETPELPKLIRPRGSRTPHLETEALSPDLCYFEGCPDEIEGGTDYCPTHAKLYAPVPAPQSSPAPLLPLSAPVETEGEVEGVRGQLADHLVPIALAAGWSPPPCNCLPFDVCDTCWGPEQQRKSQMRQLAYCEEIIPCGPEDADQCSNLREPGSVHCAQHQPSPLPADEVEWQWGCGSSIDDIFSLDEATAREHAASTGVLRKRRKAGEWVAVPVEPKETK